MPVVQLGVCPAGCSLGALSSLMCNSASCCAAHPSASARVTLSDILVDTLKMVKRHQAPQALLGDLLRALPTWVEFNATAANLLHGGAAAFRKLFKPFGLQAQVLHRLHVKPECVWEEAVRAPSRGHPAPRFPLTLPHRTLHRPLTSRSSSYALQTGAHTCAPTTAFAANASPPPQTLAPAPRRSSGSGPCQTRCS